MVAILLSTYNGQLYLKEQIDSLLDQTCKNWCLFIRDDGSSDDTLQIISTYAKKWPERIVLLTDNRGNIKPAASFMQLLSMVDMDYYMFCDQDDIWLSTKIERTYEEMVSIEKVNNNTPVVVFSDLNLVDANGDNLGITKWVEEAIEAEKAADFYYLLACPAITGCTMMINKKARESVLPYQPPLMHDRWIPLIISNCGVVHPIKEALTSYRLHGNNCEGVKVRKWSHYGSLLSNIGLSVKRWVYTFKKYKSLPYKINKLKYIFYVLRVVWHRVHNIKDMQLGLYPIMMLLGISLLSCGLNQNTVKSYPVEGTFRKEWAQGMAIFEDKAFLLNVTGLCRIYDLKKREVISDFKLGSYHAKNHANSASFGVEYPIGNFNFPAIYVSECEKPCRCFVENINMQGSKLIQTIQYQINGKFQIVHDWVVDQSNKKLYAVTQVNIPGDKNKSFVNIIRRFRLPSITEGDVIFSNKDIEEEFKVSFPHVLQGATIRKGKLYLPVGLPAGNENRRGYERAIVVIDLRKTKITKIISLQNITKNEPEGAAFWNNKLMIYCAPKDMYEFKLRDLR
jgi:glycosyltransferase involved in cell wall biosynthesis